MSNYMVREPSDDPSLCSLFYFLSGTDCFKLAGDFVILGNLLSMGTLGICGFLNYGEQYLFPLLGFYIFLDLQVCRPSL